MKKYYFISFAIALLTLLQSCTITAENTYYKDATSSMMMTMNMKEALNMIKSMGDSASKEMPIDYSKYPKDWTSLYDYEKAEALKSGEKFEPEEDSAKVLKKVFTKLLFNDKQEMEGISMKYDHLTTPEINAFSKLNSKSAGSLSSSNFINWDGEKLTIDLSELNPDALMKDVNKEGK